MAPKATRFLLAAAVVAASAGRGCLGLVAVRQPAETVLATTALTDCTGEASACFADGACSTCITSWGTEDYSTSECELRYAVVSDDRSCAGQGAGFCCDLGDEATATGCMQDRLFSSYWRCFINEFHCTIEDMPCYVPGTYLPSPSPYYAPTETPTASPSSSFFLSGDRGFYAGSQAPTASPSGTVFDAAALDLACADEALTCVQDEDCQDCLSDAEELIAVALTTAGGGVEEENYSDCRAGYLGAQLSLSGDTLEDVTTCAVVASAYCCSGDGPSDSSCRDNGASLGYWGCVFDFFGCSLEEVDCVGLDDGSYRSDDGPISVDLISSGGDDDDDALATNINGGVVARGGSPGVVVVVVVHACYAALVGLVWSALV